MSSKFLISILCLIVFAAEPLAAAQKPGKPSSQDKCPVCGMFVSKYPEWYSEIIFKDGSHFYFDGSKDMFKYYLDVRKYNPSKTLNDVDSLYVTEYYSVLLIDARTAYYVIGSDIMGPMGRELVPFSTKEDADAFVKDHKGRTIRFKDVTAAILKGLD
ncbi:MAG TPA: nitrous oxide reductase accessory protein NosL [Thermodesulfovibrionales bacterium]|jgi:nitrous oxide reductase accessory protein NosL|nr:nitrous oxide reductase accessory protein NosL [Thermodesulfovibrionales bacterium]